MALATCIRRRRYIEGESVVLDWQTESILLDGTPILPGMRPAILTFDDWRRAWDQWRDVILPKCIEHRPGTRPLAMTVVGEIEPRELRIPLADHYGWRHVDVQGDDGTATRYWLNVPEPFMEREAKHLHRLGIVSDEELRRHREWSRSGGDSYPLEVALYR